jgi:hypothetical protein
LEIWKSVKGIWGHRRKRYDVRKLDATGYSLKYPGLQRALALLKIAAQGSVWRVASVSQTPAIVLSRWSIWQTGGKRYFVGYNETD